MNERDAALLTDLYQLTMAASYVGEGMTQPATFELFARRLPRNRSFLIAAGLDDALDYLSTMRFEEEAIAYLGSLGIFEEEFLEYLRGYRFSGEVWAVPEGEAIFPNEPLLRITAPLIEAQMVETFLLNCVNFQTLIASKAARMQIACAGKQFVDFAARRTHGADAAMKVARASFIGGAVGTSNVLASCVYGIPPNGTMAHSFVMSFDREADAFLAYARRFRGRVTLLIDTYDTLEGARNAVRVAQELQAEGISIDGVRLDSGDPLELAPAVRRILDEGGCERTRIVVSGDLDEHIISRLMDAGAPIDAFGVGTQLGTSGDAPALGGVYKLVEDTRGPQLKLSPEKATLPGKKQVYRTERDGLYESDTIALVEEEADGRPLLERVMVGGERLRGRSPLDELQERCAETLRRLPTAIRDLDATGGYKVRISERLRALAEELRLRER